jgi:protoporphyrinogen oxidase
MKNNKKTPFLIIGGGPSGLAAAYRLGKKAIVLEKEDRPGGICRSFHFKGGVFDLGGHSFHTPYPEILKMVEQFSEGGLCGQKRNARCYSLGTLIPYPFQKNFDQLPDKHVVEECRLGLENRGDPSKANNFEENIIASFGRGIAKHFMLPYNRKIWARDLKRISTEWVSQRVAAPAGIRETFKTKGGQRTPLQGDTRVYYPERGGFDEIFKGMANKIHKILYNERLFKISPNEKTAMIEGGRVHRWEKIISTMPLPELLEIIEDVPEELRTAVNELEYMSLKLVFLLIGQRNGSPIQRVYCSDPSIPAHKICMNHNSSSFLKGLRKDAIVCEVSYSVEKPVDMDRLASDLISRLIEMKLIQSKEMVEDYQIHDLKYAYPVYTKTRMEIVNRAIEWLSARSIYTLGRFGEWIYINSDEAIVRAFSLADRLAADDEDGN